MRVAVDMDSVMKRMFVQLDGDSFSAILEELRPSIQDGHLLPFQMLLYRNSSTAIYIKKNIYIMRGVIRK